MDNYIKSDALSTEQEWHTLAVPVRGNYPVESGEVVEEEKTEHREHKKKLKILSPILTLQLIVCLAVLTFLFLAKTFMTGTFNSIMGWYDREVSTSMFFSGDFSSLDYSGFFASTDDEV